MARIRLSFLILLVLCMSSFSYKDVKAQSLDPRAYHYVECAKYWVHFLSNGKLDIKEYYPLLSMSNTEAIAKVEKFCAALGVDGIASDTKTKTALSKYVSERRAKLVEAVKAIRARGPRPAVILQDLYLDSGDYPKEALQRVEQGVSVIRFIIGRDGKVTQCDATGASETLNLKACEYAISRYLFVPAIDNQGNPVTEERTKNIRWSR